MFGLHRLASSISSSLFRKPGTLALILVDMDLECVERKTKQDLRKRVWKWTKRSIRHYERCAATMRHGVKLRARVDSVQFWRWRCLSVRVCVCVCEWCVHVCVRGANVCAHVHSVCVCVCLCACARCVYV